MSDEYEQEPVVSDVNGLGHFAKIAVFDLETSDLDGDFGRLLCGSILSYPSFEMKTFRWDHYSDSIADDEQIAVDIRDELEDHHITAGFYCHSPEHKVLMQDLTWKKAGDLTAGDKIISVSETPEPRRNIKPCQVISNRIIERECSRIYLENGDTFLASNNHPWLVQRKGHSTAWVKTKDLYTKADNHSSHSNFIKIFPNFQQDETRDSGWIAGFADGEGNLAQQKEPQKKKYGTGLQLAITQKGGPEINKTKEILKRFNFDFNCRQYDKDAPYMRSILLRGGKMEVIRFLGTFRPERLIRDLRIHALGSTRSKQKEKIGVERVEPAGKQKVAGLETSEGTYITEGGYCSHNSKGFDISFLNTRLIAHNQEPISRHLHFDPIYGYRGWRGIKPRSSSLRVVAEFIGCESKPSVPAEVWVDARRGDTEAMDEVVERCEADVRITAKVVEHCLDNKLLKNIKSYP